MPYFNLYLYHLDFTAAQIGIVSMTRSVSLIIFPALWARIADRFNCRRPVFVFCGVSSAVLWAFYYTAHDFTSVFIVTAVYGMFYAPVISFLEAFSMDALDRRKGEYGKVRAWGTLSFILISVIMGVVIDKFPIRIVLSSILIGSVFQAIIAPAAPRDRKKTELSHKSQPSIAGDRRILVFLVCAFLMLLSHGTYYGFFSIHLERLGYSATFIGAAWSLASVAEMCVMLNSNRILNSLSYERLLFYTFPAAALRWIVLALTSSPAAIILTQLLHAFTFGVFHITSILYMDRLTSEAAKTTGQAVNNAVTYGLGMTAGYLLNGLLYESIGGFYLFGISGFVALAGGVLFKRFQTQDGAF